MIKYSTRFGQVHCPSSGVSQHCIYKTGICRASSVGWRGPGVRGEVTGEWKKLHNEELSDLYSLPNIVRVVKSSRIRWAGHVARMGGGERCAQGSGGET